MKSRPTICRSCGTRNSRKKNGVYQCGNRNCEAVTWDLFDQPTKTGRGRGQMCWNCSKQTLHDVAIIGEYKISRCGTCSTSLVGRPQ
jgi:hypothetical protein